VTHIVSTINSHMDQRAFQVNLLLAAMLTMIVGLVVAQKSEGVALPIAASLALLPQVECRFPSQGASDGKELSQERKKVAAQNRRERKAIPLCQVPQAKPKTHQKPRPLVLPGVPKKERCREYGSERLICNVTVHGDCPHFPGAAGENGTVPFGPKGTGTFYWP
jgi:hypothetical protein